MDRLTKRDAFGNAYYPQCFLPPCLGEGCAKGTMCSFEREVCEALARYEETGYSPIEVETLAAWQDLDEEKRELLFRLKDLSSIDHLTGLLRAEQEGRLLELPAKLGSTLWRVQVTRASGQYAGAAYVKQITLTRNNAFDIVTGKQMGRTVFLTREEALEALNDG